jgi:uncharacterized protein (UPF0332 family)
VKQQCLALLVTAESKLDAARILLRERLAGDAASRAYYAAFHAVSALHLAHGSSFSSHSQLIGQFNKRFVRTGIFPPEFSRLLARLFEDRQTGDYDVAISVSSERAQQDIAAAERIVYEIRDFLSTQDTSSS